MNKYNILIVEDEFINAQFIEKAILKLGHNVIDSVETGQEALEVINEETIHVVFMDINLEGSMDGITCAKHINQRKSIPIIYTTAFSDSQTIDEATDTNLFGYLIKPYDYKDIEAVLNLTIKQNYLKKQVSLNENTQLFTQINDNYQYYVETKTLIKNGKPIELTKKESAIFYYLFINLNQTVTAEYLNQYVWNNKSVSPSALRDTILRLRKKIPDLAIRSISGLGYALNKS
ncbi:MAG: DNA-binding response regulator, OmpR family, contains REC and winged-helix (WHTH) domain [uncultured Sulfurovum sp.]|uniref:DNA-binding response regulator, OmpR family, contains REC and winged-helix (WHTH) domain n=1 Tax=uncultured Sulfurovum sp. TaxID=269237 RepID=A0A6S6T9I3_9BACT|nr:MAG: DNA-binding response regulator, OmpR family, contains REC and winged-helix (WHTH) domain [uncultured Sulfurovum sp.]